MQKYRIVQNADGTYAILTKASDCKSGLDVYDWSKSAGGNINEWNYWGGDCQKWELVTAVKNSGSKKASKMNLLNSRLHHHSSGQVTMTPIARADTVSGHLMSYTIKIMYGKTEVRVHT